MSEKITFKELVELISKQSNQSQNSANSFIHELVEIIEGGLKNSGSVSISGFGKFELRWMNERTGTNPQTGEEIIIPGQNKVIFKPYKALREDVNKPFATLKSTVLTDTEQPAEPEEDKSEAVKEDKTTIPFIAAKTKQVRRSTLSVDELLIEHENPHFPEPDPFSALAESEEDESKPTPSALPDEEKVAKEVQEAGTFNWSYAAAAIIALIAFIILFFMFQRMGDSPAPATTDQTEQVITPITPDAIPETEPSEPPEPQPPEPQTELETVNYTVEPGESLWTIAESSLGNPYLWPIIYQLNGDLISNPNQLPAVSDIDIPVISDPDNLTEFEREQVALGYFALYEWNRQNNPDEARFFLWAVGVFSPDLLEQPPSEVDPNDLAFALNR